MISGSLPDYYINQIASMLLNLKDLGKLINISFQEWYIKDPFRQSAIIAYFSIFSIPGLLLLIITFTSFFFGTAAVDQNIFSQISSTMGEDTATQIKDILINAGKAKTTILGSILGLLILLIGATGVFVELQKSLNAIWNVKADTKTGFLPVIKSRLFSFGLILAIAFLLLISLVISSALAAMGSWINVGTSYVMLTFFNIINFFVSLVVVAVLFGLMFKILPDAEIKWKHVWLGSFVTSFLFTIGKSGLAFYFGTIQPGNIYGVAGSIILILLWVSYSTMIMFYGAEFTVAYVNMYSVPNSGLAIKNKPGDTKL